MKYWTLLLFFVFFYFGAKSQCLQANMSILLDWSGSEYGNEKEIVKASLNFIESLPISENGVRMSIKTFSFISFYDLYNYQNIVDMTYDRDELNSGVLSLLCYPPTGGTVLSGAMNSAIYDFKSNYRGYYIPNIIIIISDGDIYDVQESYDIIKTYKEQSILNVFAIQIGGDKEGFVNLTQLTGSANNVEVSTTDKLIEAFKKLNLCN
jgi:uncharacterized protein YegL